MINMSEYVLEFKTVLCNIHNQTFKDLKPMLDNANVTFPQFMILELLSENSLKMSEIAERMHVSLPAVTGFVDKLTKLEYLKRSNDPSDRRVTLVSLTEKGKSTHLEIQSKRLEKMAKTFSQFSEDELSKYIELMRKLEGIILNK